MPESKMRTFQNSPTNDFQLYFTSKMSFNQKFGQDLVPP